MNNLVNDMRNGSTDWWKGLNLVRKWLNCPGTSIMSKEILKNIIRLIISSSIYIVSSLWVAEKKAHYEIYLLLTLDVGYEVGGCTNTFSSPGTMFKLVPVKKYFDEYDTQYFIYRVEWWYQKAYFFGKSLMYLMMIHVLCQSIVLIIGPRLINHFVFVNKNSRRGLFSEQLHFIFE
jgi:hypothetical protein